MGSCCLMDAKFLFGNFGNDEKALSRAVGVCEGKNILELPVLSARICRETKVSLKNKV